jgi:hypothetical protein
MIADRSRARRVIAVHRVEPSGLDRRYGRGLGCESIVYWLDSGNARMKDRHAGHGFGQVELDTRTILRLLLLRPSQPHFEIDEIGPRHAGKVVTCADGLLLVRPTVPVYRKSVASLCVSVSDGGRNKAVQNSKQSPNGPGRDTDTYKLSFVRLWAGSGIVMPMPGGPGRAGSTRFRGER